MSAQAMLDMLIDRVRSFGFETVFGRWYGTYAAIVEDVNDPDNRGRVRLRVPSMGQKKAPKSTWARPAAFSPSEGSGIFFPPDVGSRVWVVFEGGHPSKPLYLGGVLGKGKNVDEFDAYFKRGIRTPAGHLIKLSDEDGVETITVQSAAGGYFHMNENGSLLMASEAGSYVNISADMDGSEFMVIHDIGGSLVQLAGGDVTVSNKDGTYMAVNGDGMQVVTSQDIALNCAGNVSLKAGTVDIAEGADQSVVLGDSLASLFNSHTHGSPAGTTTPPSAPMVAGVHLSTRVKTG